MSGLCSGMQNCNDLAVAVDSFFRAAARGYAGALEDAEEAVGKGDYATAIPIYRSLAEKGNVSASCRYA